MGAHQFRRCPAPGAQTAALKGIGGLTAVTRVRDISSNWRVFQRAAEAIGSGVAEVRGTGKTGKTGKAEMIAKQR
ncbi:hypothetical protein HMSSN036_14140 [Paenibacillus macerans]|nr:hypothetical protein HMSSN036_14140 [Paenibacillus macerans]